MTPADAIRDALTALVAPDGLVPSRETVELFQAHLRSIGFAVRPIGLAPTAAPFPAQPVELGRVVAFPRPPGSALVLLLVRREDGSFDIGDAIEVGRVPCVAELVLVPGVGTFRVLTVRHTPGAPGDAELYVEPVVADVHSLPDGAAKGG
jgi:hypothetical protein